MGDAEKLNLKTQKLQKQVEEVCCSRMPPEYEILAA